MMGSDVVELVNDRLRQREGWMKWIVGGIYGK